MDNFENTNPYEIKDIQPIEPIGEIQPITDSDSAFGIKRENILPAAAAGLGVFYLVGSGKMNFLGLVGKIFA